MIQRRAGAFTLAVVDAVADAPGQNQVTGDIACDVVATHVLINVLVAAETSSDRTFLRYL